MYLYSRFAEVLDTLVNGIHGLWVQCWSTGRFAKDQLGLQAPGWGHIVRSLELLVDGWVVMLEIACEPLGFESSPEDKLVHAT